jgi:quercetin dioxygenase-like cupin family protein
LRFTLSHHPAGVRLAGGDRVAYDVAGETAHHGTADVAGRALVWTLGDDPPEGGEVVLAADVELDPATPWLMRCDRVDFEPGGIAHRHVHPGPGIRCLLFGRITIDTEGAEHTYGPGGAWFETGPDPVLATTAPDEPTAFARVLLLPAEWEGKRTISYVDPADADKPKTQRATIFLERPVGA